MHEMSEEESSPRPLAADRSFNPILAVVGVLTQPVTAMRELAAARPWRVAVGLLLAIAVVTELLHLLRLRGMVWPGIAGAAPPPEATEWDEPLLAALGGMLAPVLLRSGLLVLEVSLVYVVGRGLGGRGPFSALLATQAFAALPSLLPAVAGPTVLRDLEPSATELVGLGLVNVGSGLWGLALGVLGVRASLGLSTSRAAAARLIGLAGGVGLTMATGTVFGALGGTVSGAWLLAPSPGGPSPLVVLGLILVGVLGIGLLDRVHGASRGAAQDAGDR